MRLVLGLRDYVTAVFGVLLGLSGGIDSALYRRRWRWMPWQGQGEGVHAALAYTSRRRKTPRPAPSCSGHRATGRSRSEPRYAPSERACCSGIFTGRNRRTRPENIQSRAARLTPMALSNKLSHMVLTTGNKSENRWVTRRFMAMAFSLKGHLLR